MNLDRNEILETIAEIERIQKGEIKVPCVLPITDYNVIAYWQLIELDLPHDLEIDTSKVSLETILVIYENPMCGSEIVATLEDYLTELKGKL